MRHIQNNTMRDVLQQTLLAQAVADAAKLRQDERVRAQAAEASVKFQDQAEGKLIKKVPGKAEDGKGGSREQPQGSPQEGNLQDGNPKQGGGPSAGSGPSSRHRLDLKV